ncbi:MAG TPA: polyprenyl synthetase family protein [Spirochaetia bacterium]|nr:polyprenyl synthetase family protein [Spirochaetia bacterium]
MQTTFARDTLLDADIAEVKKAIYRQLEGSSGEIRDAVSSMVEANAKMLRPTFLLLAARIGKFAAPKFYDLAAAVEMLHMATLAHDDVIDDSPTRRGKAALHTLYGKRTAILIGDLLFSRCFHLAAEYTTIENGRKLARAVSVICESEIRQGTDRFSLDVSRRRYLRRITGKTSALFVLSFYIGGQESGAPKRTVSALHRAGYNIGMAFQIIDDILDYSGDAHNLGKPTGTDLREGVITIPLIYALEQDRGDLRKLLDEFPYTDDTVADIIAMTGALGGIQRARELAELYTNRALRELSRLPGGRSKELLIEYVKTLLVRDF